MATVGEEANVELSAAVTYFFTVNLEDRSSGLLIERVEDRWTAWAYVQDRHPFETVAAVVLPDHLHCIWVLPPGGRDFPMRWRLLKAHFSRSLAKVGLAGEGRRPGRAGLVATAVPGAHDPTWRGS